MLKRRLRTAGGIKARVKEQPQKSSCDCRTDASSAIIEQPQAFVLFSSERNATIESKLFAEVTCKMN